MSGLFLSFLFLMAIIFPILSAVLMVKKRNARGFVCGMCCILSQLTADWMWYTAAAKGRMPWYELAFSGHSRGSIITMAILAIGLILAIANAVVFFYRREKM